MSPLGKGRSCFLDGNREFRRGAEDEVELGGDFWKPLGTAGGCIVLFDMSATDALQIHYFGLWSIDS